MILVFRVSSDFTWKYSQIPNLVSHRILSKTDPFPISAKIHTWPLFSDSHNHFSGYWPEGCKDALET
jgi:hypothetical protein